MSKLPRVFPTVLDCNDLGLANAPPKADSELLATPSSIRCPDRTAGETDASDAATDMAALAVKATGAGFMKSYDDLTEPMMRSLERACDKHGLKMMGHVPAGILYEDARISELQHFFGVPAPSTLEIKPLADAAPSAL
jgi:hypothetical protein